MIECHARIVCLVCFDAPLECSVFLARHGARSVNVASAAGPPRLRLRTSRTPSETPSESRPRAARRRSPTALRPSGRRRGSRTRRDSLGLVLLRVAAQ